MKEIQDSELENYGISLKHNIMDNGEKRFRLIGKDGSSYIRTESTEEGAWQNSHYHTSIKELYLVQKGTIKFVELIDDKLVVNIYSEGEFCISKPMIPHNVYMSPNTITHTIKYGDCSNADWNACEELDEMIENT